MNETTQAAIDDGGPAYPMPSGPEPRDKSTTHYNEGMSLRDWFAGQALVGLIANDSASANNTHSQDARFCYGAADAMLAARKAVPHD